MTRVVGTLVGLVVGLGGLETDRGRGTWRRKFCARRCRTLPRAPAYWGGGGDIRLAITAGLVARDRPGIKTTREEVFSAKLIVLYTIGSQRRVIARAFSSS